MGIYKILEVANTHGGNKDYLISLIKEFERFRDCGMKFQPFKYDKIATSDFEWYPVYEKLYFNETEWDQIIKEASKTKDIWLDLFDEYSITILNNHLKSVYGLKLQASVLNNRGLINILSKIDLAEIVLVINISGISIDEIGERAEIINKQLNPRELLLEVGFQAYPTSVADSGLNKIKTLKSLFPYRLVFADHVDGSSPEAIWLPVMSIIQGADVIEKHIKHSTKETEYDHYSSIDVNSYSSLNDKIELFQPIMSEPFINKREEEYLQKTIQIPILNKDLLKGETIDIDNDLAFKRSGLNGLRLNELIQSISTFHIAANDLKQNFPVTKKDLKKATIATIIACRLKSTRLTQKALLKLGELTSIETCIKNCLKFKNVNHTILATSDLKEDEPLKNYLYRDDVIFHRGDPEDVIRRYIDICDHLKVDVVVRVTGDMPYVSDEIFDLLLSSHFQQGADFTWATNSAVGSSCEIVNVSSLRLLKKYFPSADYSEYMSWYLRNNPEFFTLNPFELPSELSRDYRLTIDYEDDLLMFKKIEEHFSNSEFGLKEIFEFLDNNPDIASINSGITLKYQTDQDLIARLNKYTKIQ